MSGLGGKDYIGLMKKCAFLTQAKTGGYVSDDEYAIAPLNELGWQVSTVPWRQTNRPWNDFDVVIIRSTWDYWNDVSAFVETLERIDQETKLVNRLGVVRWNLSKTYLRDLEAKGIGIVPTLWANSLQVSSFKEFQGRLGTADIVVKPVVGANGEDAFHISSGDPLKRLDHIAERFQNRDCMVQPFMPNIVREGEYSLFFFNGKYSHAILKIPAKSEFRSQEEHGADVHPVVPQEKLLLRARQVLGSLTTSLLYARIDFVRNDADDFLVMELELIEPSLYLGTDSQAAGRFAAAVDLWARTA
jgi:glutathione synthase/RimK-type ligase-like ATP-grasp enzyme